MDSYKSFLDIRISVIYEVCGIPYALMLPYEGYEIYPDNESDTDRIKISGADEDLNHVSNLDAQHPIQINGRPFLNLEFSKI